MNVSVFGLGYVGSVSAACFAEDGHQVVGVDVAPAKVQSLNEGRSPIVEKGLDELIRDNTANGRLRATTSTADAVRDTDLSLICVGTPSRKNGSLDLTYLERVAEQIGHAPKDKADYHVGVVRSTGLQGTTHEVVIPALERLGRGCGIGFGVTVNPEFLREGRRSTPGILLTLVGHNYQSDAELTRALCEGRAPMGDDHPTAEMMSTEQHLHALKVTFANGSATSASGSASTATK